MTLLFEPFVLSLWCLFIQLQQGAGGTQERKNTRTNLQRTPSALCQECCVGVRKTTQVCSMKVREIDFSSSTWRVKIITFSHKFNLVPWQGCCESSFLVVKQLKLSLRNWMSFQINLDDVWGWGMFTGWRHVHYLLLTTDCKLSKLGQGCNAATDQFAVSFMCGKGRHSTNRILSPEEYDNSICTCQ